MKLFDLVTIVSLGVAPAYATPEDQVSCLRRRIADQLSLSHEVNAKPLVTERALATGAVATVAALGVADKSYAQTAAQPSGTIQPFPTDPANQATLPTSIVSGSTIELNCGKTYFGSLNLKKLSGVTVKTVGMTPNCGRAVITPATPVTNWHLERPNVYVADAPQEITQVLVDGQLMGMAHYPNNVKESEWLQATGSADSTLYYSGLPSNDIVGAKVTYRGSLPWDIGTRTVTAYQNGVMTLPPNTDINLNAEDTNLGNKDIGFARFYLEGKPWMIDSPGEWAWSNGKLYIYMPDGQRPGSRVLAAPKARSVIDARGTTNLTLDSVRIVGGEVGVDASNSDYGAREDAGIKGASALIIRNSEIAYSNFNAIYASNGEGLNVAKTDVTGALHSGIYARTGSKGTRVTDSHFTNVGNVGMHKGGQGAIFLNNDDHAYIVGNTITNAGKSGIYIGQSTNSYVAGNIVNGACRVHGDCGGIYLFNRGSQQNPRPLHTKIENNLVKNVNGDPARLSGTNLKPERYGIYLDDETSGAIIYKNKIFNNDSGMQVHLGFDNLIQENTFSGNTQRGVLLAESGGASGSMHNNTFSGNTFVGPAPAYFFAVKNPIIAVGKPTTATSTATATLDGNFYQNYVINNDRSILDPSNASIPVKFCLNQSNPSAPYYKDCAN